MRHVRCRTNIDEGLPLDGHASMNLAKPGETCTGSLVAHYYTYVGTDSRGVPEYIKAKMRKLDDWLLDARDRVAARQWTISGAAAYEEAARRARTWLEAN